MIDSLLASLAPHHCFGCGEIGTILCLCCENNMLDEPFLGCLVCRGPVSHNNLCYDHDLGYDMAWCFLERRDVIQGVIDSYKFHGTRSASVETARLIDNSLPDMPKETVVVPIPTSPGNIRRRGYDHMLLIGRELAKRRKLELSTVLRRTSNATQHFSKTAAQRHEQADSFFEIRRDVDPDKIYLIIDDIFTTGATVNAAANCLRKHGATSVWVAVIARQV